MNLPLDQLVSRVRLDSSYRRAFGADFTDAVTAANIARALASYVRTIRSGDSPVDHFAAGDRSALPPDARRGRALFMGRAGCFVCHSGANFSDEQFHNTGISAGTTDAGRFALTHRPADLGAFKTPTLREVARTAPYMHDGSFATLEDVVDFYDRGGHPNPALDREIHPLGLSMEEKHDLVAFLRALSGTVSAGAAPRR